MVCVRLIIGEGRERDKRSVDRLIQNNLDGREGTAMLGTKRGRSRRLPTPPTPREVVSLHHSDYNPTLKTQKSFRGGEVGRRETKHTRGRSLTSFLGEGTSPNPGGSRN